MPEALWLVATALTAFLGMSWLALAMKVHWQQVFDKGNTLPNTTLLRWLGCLALLASAICALQADHASMAALVWVMLLTAVALAVAMVLARNPKWLRLVCPPQFGTLSLKHFSGIQ